MLLTRKVEISSSIFYFCDVFKQSVTQDKIALLLAFAIVYE